VREQADGLAANGRIDDAAEELEGDINRCRSLSGTLSLPSAYNSMG
jgi:hypothetical protein